MKILLTSIGSRGDMEPFIAIGALLKQKGHEVICQFPEQFRKLVEDTDMRFVSLGPEFLEMLESDLGKKVLGGGVTGWQKIMLYAKLWRLQQKTNRKLIELQQQFIEEEKPDRILHNGKAMYPVIWEVKNAGKTVFLSPVPFLHYVKGHTHLAFHSDYGEWLNKLTYKIGSWGLIKTIMTSMKWLGITDINKKEIEKAHKEHKVVYTISPQLFEQPDYWPKNQRVLGYYERDRAINWSPSPELLSFLERHPKLIFITFGSMTNPEPEKKTRIILDILQRNNTPAIINTAEGGLVEPEQYDKNLLHFVSNIPYEWIFPKMYGVIHHGGSGTTHMAIKYGCASMIVPHIIDQFVWNGLIEEHQVGPKGPKIGALSTKSLEPKLLDLVNNKTYKANAEKMGKKMMAEDYWEELYGLIVE